LISREVPTVENPCGSALSTAITQAPSMRATMAGVAYTGKPPLPQAMAVFCSVTEAIFSPFIPEFKKLLNSMDKV
jgi:hypothetical protein